MHLKGLISPVGGINYYHTTSIHFLNHFNICQMKLKFKQLNWKYALGEIALIFIGITLAIMFQNFNEDKKREKTERSALMELKVALHNDLEDVNDNIQTHIRGKESCQLLLEKLNSDRKIDGAKILQSAYQSSDFTFLVSDVSTYEYLKSVGLHLISNEELRRQITNLYDVVYESVYGVENNHELIQTSLVNEIKKYFTADQNQFILIGDGENLKSNNIIKFDIKNYEFSHNLMIQKYQEKVKPELEKLIKLVDAELGK